MNFVKAQYRGRAASTITRRETMAAFFGNTAVCSVWSGSAGPGGTGEL